MSLHESALLSLSLLLSCFAGCLHVFLLLQLCVSRFLVFLSLKC